MKKNMIIKDKKILGGKPVIEGTRIPVSSVITQYKNGHGRGHVREMFPHISEKQIDAALDYASKKLDEVR